MIRANRLADLPRLRWAFRSTASVLYECGLGDNRPLRRFIDEQLMITAQAEARETPFLFAAPALCYTHATNYYLPGGMIQLPAALAQRLGQLGGELLLRQRVDRIERTRSGWRVLTQKGGSYETRAVLSNLPVWNLPEITEGKVKEWAQKKADRHKDYWGAFTLSLVVEDVWAADFSLHHQIILPDGETFPVCGSRSVFVSFSAKDDRQRAPAGERVLALSTHAAKPEQWSGLDRDEYAKSKNAVAEAMIAALERHLPGFRRELIRYRLESSPVSWQGWIFRRHGSVGGLPQRMGKVLGGLGAASTPFEGLVLCGDTVYPGQGVPGVALGGIIAAKYLVQGLSGV